MMSNDNKKICVVGAGKWGKNHIRTLTELNALGGIVETEKKTYRDLLINMNSYDIFNCLDAAIEASFDGYIVATPPSTHFKIAKKIILSGNHLLVEKPLTLDSKSAIELVDLAKKNNVNLMVGHVLLFHPGIQKMKEIIKNGDIGEIQYLYSNRLNLGTFRNNENVFWSFAPHDISLFNFFTNQMPIQISSNGADIIQKNIHDTTITTLKYNNIMGHIFVSWLHPFKEHRFVIIGSKAMLHIEDSIVSKPLMLYNKKAEIIDSLPKPKIGESIVIDYENIEPLKNELKYFISKLDNSKLELASGESAIDVIKILEQASSSLNGN